jgi:membrane protease YdiL (CAAX protease family)
MLAGYAGFPLFRRRLYANYGTEPPRPPPDRAPLPAATVLRYAFGALLVALPVLTLLSLGWSQLLHLFGLPEEPQNLVAIFRGAKSPAIVAFMLLVACGLAPLTEELVFRAGLYRFVRQKLGRTPALLVSGLGFGALHANWAGFVPLAALGMILALAYEASGSIRVAIAAHALFNLNTVLLVLAGLGGKV